MLRGMAEPVLDVVIVGAGAAGLMAAIFAGRAAREAGERRTIVALDGAKKLGAKVLIAGGGRCNVTHDVVHPHDYAGASSNAIKRVLRSFTVEQTVAFFADLGVTLKREDTGKLFPITDSARTVLDALLRAAHDAGAELRTQQRVRSVRRIDDADGPRFAVRTDTDELHARRVVLATGGLALPSTGSDGAGYGFAKKLGHTVTDTWPALVPLLLTEGHWLTALSGVTLLATLTLAETSGRVLHRQAGSLLFTHFGLSGPAAMDLSRHWLERCRDGRADAAKLTLNLAPDATFEVVDASLTRAAADHPRGTVVNALKPWVPERVALALCERGAGVATSTTLATLKRDDRRALAHALTALPLPVAGDRGFRFAECTAGGVPLEEVELATMASRRCPGLFLCGELLNVDGRIGGYNFQWAWCTGRLAGCAAAGGEW
jgi:predicted Rossmann fold flavoprotein